MENHTNHLGSLIYLASNIRYFQGNPKSYNLTPDMFTVSSMSSLFKTGLLSMGLKGQSFNSLVITRNLMKTHKGAAKRWRKSAQGFKRGIAGRNHGNVGWSHRYLNKLTGRKEADPTHVKHLKRMLPYH
ncbi:mitochondrial 54S ribosomal protein bL35m NDAI_0F02820 [Naumovozyma dairenensis CBS 421]|uniref:50S ribosomal protein L35 n=1 Tax=Naumovozyma dairenensis (strain ATCC 10597 / BCRC 20456 / CBS 421 / NBRC 0211 / NRRL Y-12639) TaxID=1071378 RepID=G0WCT9_NAUDC|nr:hypothetical protein NDAI_0F02820 [Naumovozyma dairenensis CBS 421]CCD25600.1 hypothetical protein NDAI_0F02820 [Naumovozyma dairenensis CBS 421]